MVWEVAVTKEEEVDPSSAAKNEQFLNKQWGDCSKFYHEMIYEKVAGVTWSNPVFNYCPSTTANANGKLCNIVVALNVLRILAAHVRYEQVESSEELMMFGSHVMDWLAPDKKGIGSPGKSNFRHSIFELSKF